MVIVIWLVHDHVFGNPKPFLIQVRIKVGSVLPKVTRIVGKLDSVQCSPHHLILYYFGNLAYSARDMGLQKLGILVSQGRCSKGPPTRWLNPVYSLSSAS